MNLSLGALALVLGLSSAGQAFGQDCKKPVPADKAEAVLEAITFKRQVSNCYAVTANPEPEPSLNNAASLLKKAEAEKTPAERLQTIAALLQWMREWPTTGVDDDAVRDALQRKMSEARTALLLADVSNQAMATVTWSVNGRGDGELYSNVLPNDFTVPIRKSCTGKPEHANGCNQAVAEVEAIIRAHVVMQSALRIASRDALADLTDLFAKRAKMWDAYRTEARPQYPWEWVLNGVLFKDERPKDTAGNPRGPANLPGAQWILLHPGVGLERFDARQTDQSANNPTLYIEWLGYNRLNWDYDAGKLRGGLGVSLVSVYAARQDAKDWSNGVMFWVSNKYGLAVTRNSEGTSLMVSVDVGELFRDQLNQLNQVFRAGLPSK